MFSIKYLFKKFIAFITEWIITVIISILCIPCSITCGLLFIICKIYVSIEKNIEYKSYGNVLSMVMLGGILMPIMLLTINIDPLNEKLMNWYDNKVYAAEYNFVSNV